MGMEQNNQTWNISPYELGILTSQYSFLMEMLQKNWSSNFINKLSALTFALLASLCPLRLSSMNTSIQHLPVAPHKLIYLHSCHHNVMSSLLVMPNLSTSFMFVVGGIFEETDHCRNYRCPCGEENKRLNANKKIEKYTKNQITNVKYCSILSAKSFFGSTDHFSPINTQDEQLLKSLMTTGRHVVS